MNGIEENMYGDIEKKIYHDIRLGVEVPDEFKKVIRGDICKNEKNYSLVRMLTITCASLLITAGIVYAGSVIYEKIWREPEKLVGYTNIYNENITEKDLESIMIEEEAIERVESILERTGYGEGKIKSMELEKFGERIDWNIETDNKISISFDARGGTRLCLFSDNLWGIEIEHYRTTIQGAEKTARELCKKYGYDVSEYNSVKIHSNSTERLTNEPDEDESYIWYVDFYKEYDNLVNEYDKISIAFVPEINELYYFIVTKGKDYENNSVEITEEQAKETALKEEQKTNIKYELKELEVNLGIVAMNGEAYARTTDYEQFAEQRNWVMNSKIDYPKEKYIEYHTDGRVRKAWKVDILYEVPFTDILDEAFINRSR